MIMFTSCYSLSLTERSRIVSRNDVRGKSTSELIALFTWPAQDMQSMQRRMELLRNEVMAAVASGRWQPPAGAAASSVGEL